MLVAWTPVCAPTPWKSGRSPAVLSPVAILLEGSPAINHPVGHALCRVEARALFSSLLLLRLARRRRCCCSRCRDRRGSGVASFTGCVREQAFAFNAKPEKEMGICRVWDKQPSNQNWKVVVLVGESATVLSRAFHPPSYFGGPVADTANRRQGRVHVSCHPPNVARGVPLHSKIV